MPELTADSADAQRALRCELLTRGLVFEAKPLLQRFPWSVSDITSNNHITLELGLGHKTVFPRPLLDYISRLDARPLTDERQRAALRQYIRSKYGTIVMDSFIFKSGQGIGLQRASSTFTMRRVWRTTFAERHQPVTCASRLSSISSGSATAPLPSGSNSSSTGQENERPACKPTNSWTPVPVDKPPGYRHTG